jgi:hypothetical protein
VRNRNAGSFLCNAPVEAVSIRICRGDEEAYPAVTNGDGCSQE